MNLLLRKVINCYILKTTPPKDSAHISSIEDSFESFKSRPYLTSHVIRMEKTPKLESHLNPKIEISVNRFTTPTCLMLRMGFTKLALPQKL